MISNILEKKTIRLDIYLYYIRIFKSRSIATKFVLTNRLRISGQVTQKPHKMIIQNNKTLNYDFHGLVKSDLDENGAWKNLMNQKNSSADISPTAGQMPRLVGLAQASKV